jgi:hypothetical protein
MSQVTKIPVADFLSNVLPRASKVEVMVTPEHANKLVSLIAPADTSSPSLLKWDNGISWSYNGNVADSMRDRVQMAGGSISGVLRFSIMWNEDGKDILDFDAHAKEPNGTEIYFSSYIGYPSGMSGMLDVDMIRNPKKSVENIVWSDLRKMKDGVYKFWIHNYDGGHNKGFKAEIEFGGETYAYEWNQHVAGRGTNVKVAEVTLKGGQFSIVHKIPESSVSSKEIYGIETNQFHKVNLICTSPNHWGNNAVGNKHFMFMLDGCKTPDPIRGFHSENLVPELYELRRVLEPFGSFLMIPPADKQLSGLGFNATVRDEVILKLQGTHKRMVKVKF